MSSLKQRVDELLQDLLADPMRISAYHDLPFAILRYDPADEFALRKTVEHLTIKLRNAAKRVHTLSIGRFLWEAIRATEGVAAIADEERQFGFQRAQQTVATLLSDSTFSPLADQIQRRIHGLKPSTDIVFLLRVASLGPAIYRSAKLLDEMHRRTMVPIVLFYPGSLDGDHSLRFLGLPEREQTGAYNYRVKIY
jgi:hypothetical protein